MCCCWLPICHGSRLVRALRAIEAIDAVEEAKTLARPSEIFEGFAVPLGFVRDAQFGSLEPLSHSRASLTPRIPRVTIARAREGCRHAKRSR
jgi:hypothetical protein